MREKIIKIIEDVTGEKINKYNYEEITPQNIESWDSMAHLNIIVSLEEEFSVSFDADEIEAMQSGLKEIERVISEKSGNGVN